MADGTKIYGDITEPTNTTSGYFIGDGAGLVNLPASNFSAEADSNLVAGMPIYVKNTGHIEKAQADASGTSTVSGLMIQDVLSGFAGKFAKDGSITLADWTSITGFVTLSAGLPYYLSPSVAGMLTSTAPTTVGQYVVKAGIALSTTTMAIEIEPKILL